MKQHQTMKPLPVGRIPGWEMLCSDYSWVDDFVKAGQLRERLHALRVDRAGIEARPVSKDEFTAGIIEEFERRREAQINNLALHLGQHAAPGAHKAALVRVKLQPLPPRDILEAALSRVGTDGIGSEDRAAELDRIDSETRATEQELEDTCPPHFAVKPDGDEPGDLRERFHRHWQRVQSKCNAPCGPRGVSLEASEPAERQAWASLGLAKHVNHETHVEPAPPPRFE